MANEVRFGSGQGDTIADYRQPKLEDKRNRSIFDVPPDFFDSCRLIKSLTSTSVTVPFESLAISEVKTLGGEAETEDELRKQSIVKNSIQRLSCNTCTAEFESLQDQRSHFKSDIHRFNIKLTIAGKDTVKEEDFDEACCNSLFEDNDVSSISGSEDEDDRETDNMIRGAGEGGKKKIFACLQSGERVSFWKCLLLDESENIILQNDKSVLMDYDESVNPLTETGIIEKLKNLIIEPRNNSCLRVVLLARGGHFAGCIFDGNSMVAHKTFHRYVVRAKAGKKQSSKDASGRGIHSAGASLRRHNELALKKEIQELLASWRPYFDASSCIFLYAPSSNRQLFFDGEKANLSCWNHAVRNVPLTVRRPTLKEARRVYNLLVQVYHEVDEHNTLVTKEDSTLTTSIVSKEQNDNIDVVGGNLKTRETDQPCSCIGKPEKFTISSESEDVVIGKTTPLHEAAKSGNAEKVLELLEQGLDPCIKDERGRTPYMLAAEKEIRNMFRRFMASNMDRWDWHSAKVPSALTKEMEESQATKQAEKDAKRKARSKELKKFRRTKEKKAQAQAAQSQKVPNISDNGGASSVAVLKGQPHNSGGAHMSKEEELKRARDTEREKRAAAAEKRIAAAAACQAVATASCSSLPRDAVASDVSCSCCNMSLAGKIPFHRYSYKYCSSSCMHIHREILEDG